MSISTNPSRSPLLAWNIRTFGALGDGQQLDSVAIQAAIDACHAAGGGLVYCPPGTYRCGTILLKSHVELHLEAGATLLGSTDRADYRKLFQKDAIARKFNNDEHLICARGQRHIALTGRGTINGNALPFLVPHPKGPAYGLEVRDWRPGQLVTFIDCEDVHVRDIRIIDSPSWTIWIHACRRVEVQGVAIHNTRGIPNADGIDIICSSEVHVNNCSIDAGDDCVCVYALNYDISERPSENVTVTNCTLTTRCCGVRVGYWSDGLIRNCTFSNLVMYNIHTGIDVLSGVQNDWRCEIDPDVRRGPQIENIVFSNLTIYAKKAIYLWHDDQIAKPAGIRHLRISDLIASTTHACYLSGTPQVPLEHITIANAEITMRGKVDDRYVKQVPYPGSPWGQPGIPHAFYVRHARDIALNNVRLNWGAMTGPWQSALRAEHVDTLDLHSFVATTPPGSPAPVIDLVSVRDASLRACRALGGGKPFLHLDSASSATAVGNDFAHAAPAFAADTGSILKEIGNLLA